jgi:hypothetical protein
VESTWLMLSKVLSVPASEVFAKLRSMPAIERKKQQ